MNEIDITSIIGDDLYLHGVHVATIKSNLHASERQELINMWLDYHKDVYIREKNIKNRAYAEGYAEGTINGARSRI